MRTRAKGRGIPPGEDDFASAEVVKRRGRWHLGDERPWLLILAILATIELFWWMWAWRLGVAPAPLLADYLLFAGAGLAAAIMVRMGLRLPPIATNWRTIAAGTILVALGASLFLPLKYAIPAEIPFWLDRPLALSERAVFGADPWWLLDRSLGWAAVPLDWLYGAWLPTQTLVMFLVLTSKPSPAKTRALIAYALAWFLLGVIAALLLSSAGPLFYDRLNGGHDFAALPRTLRSRGVWIALAESDAMWRSLATRRPGLVAGISAMPSIHVAIALWIFLTARALRPRAAPFAAAYVVLIGIASVQLGWHYVGDGLVGAIGMVAIWRLARCIAKATSRRGAHSAFGRLGLG